MADQFRNQSILKGWMSHVIYYLHSIVHTHLVRFFTTLLLGNGVVVLLKLGKNQDILSTDKVESSRRELFSLLIRTQNCFNFVAINEIFF